jgi:hypothetical protein
MNDELLNKIEENIFVFSWIIKLKKKTQHILVIIKKNKLTSFLFNGYIPVD